MLTKKTIFSLSERKLLQSFFIIVAFFLALDFFSVAHAACFNVGTTTPGTATCVTIPVTITVQFSMTGGNKLDCTTVVNQSTFYVNEPSGPMLGGSITSCNENSRTFTFTSSDLKPGKTFTYTVTTGRKDKTTPIPNSLCSNTSYTFSTVPMGDIDQNCAINSTDVTNCLDYANGAVTPSASQKTLADMDVDTFVNADDCLLIFQQTLTPSSPMP